MSSGGTPAPQERMPVPRVETTGGLARPEDRVASALQMQVELLRAMHERQERLEETLSDTRRSEMMLSSTRSLNESFRGMRRVQEALLEEIGERPGGGRGRLLLVLGVLLLAGAVVFGAWQLGKSVDRATRRLDAGRGEALMKARLEAMQSRIQLVQDEKKRQELDEGMRNLSESISDLKSSRKAAQEELSRLKQIRQRELAELASYKQRSEQAEKEVQRLTEEVLAKGRLMAALSAQIESGGKGNGASRPREAAPKPLGQPADSRHPAAAATSEVASPRVSDGPFPPVRLALLNRLLQGHRGSDSYSLRSAGALRQGVLKDVELEVRSKDGDLVKEVVASNLTLALATRGAFLELVFSKGSVAYHQARGQVIKSPFFRNEYSVGVFGVDRKAWLAAGFSFLKVR